MMAVPPTIWYPRFPDLVGDNRRCLGCNRKCQYSEAAANHVARIESIKRDKPHYIQVCPYGNGWHVSDTQRSNALMCPSKLNRRVARLRDRLRRTRGNNPDGRPAQV